MILSRRVNDNDHRDGFTKWPFMTTHTWGEYPQGTWTLEVMYNKHKKNHAISINHIYITENINGINISNSNKYLLTPLQKSS